MLSGGTIEDDSPNVVNQLNLKLEAVQDLQEVVQDIEVVTEDHHQVVLAFMALVFISLD